MINMPLGILLVVLLIACACVLLRAFGAWMFRINEVINASREATYVNKQILEQLKRMEGE